MKILLLLLSSPASAPLRANLLYFIMNAPFQETRPGASCDKTYLELIGSLVNTLINRLVLFYKRRPDDQLLFRQAIQELQDNISHYEQSKPIKFSLLLKPLIAQLRLNTIRQHFPNDVISEASERQCQIQQTAKPTIRRAYCSNNSLDVHRNFHLIGTMTSSPNIRDQWASWGRQQKTGNVSAYFPDVEERKSSHSRRKGRSLKTHNYEKQVARAYDKIIGTVVNTKPFKRKRYQNKIENLVKMSDYPECPQ